MRFAHLTRLKHKWNVFVHASAVFRVQADLRELNTRAARTRPRKQAVNPTTLLGLRLALPPRGRRELGS